MASPPSVRSGSALSTPNPVPDLLQPRQWEALQCLSLLLPSLEKLPVELVLHADQWSQWMSSVSIHKQLPPLWDSDAPMVAKAVVVMLILQIVKEVAVSKT